MKFFKHFVDADSGSLNDLMNKLGVEAYGRYWLFVELCVSKLEKKKDEEFAEEHVRFNFNSRQLRNKLRIKSLGLQIFLTSCRDQSLFQWDLVEDKHSFYFPNILKSMDRDAKRARPDRGPTALKKKKKIEEEEKESASAENPKRLAAKNQKQEDFFGILDSMRSCDMALREADKLKQFEEALCNEHAFGDSPPALFKKTKQKFLATLVSVYPSVNDFKTDLTAIVNETLADTKVGASRADYVQTRVKNKALELYNATI
jgi:hypothetical protein